MSDTVKLLFDENFSRPLIRDLATLAAYSPDNPSLTHLLELSPPGVGDDVWIPRVASEGFIVITADRGKRSGGPKLPAVCEANNVTHLLLSGRVSQTVQFEKARALLAVWPELLETVMAPKGSRFLLKLSNARKPTLVQVK